MDATTNSSTETEESLLTTDPAETTEEEPKATEEEPKATEEESLLTPAPEYEIKLPKGAKEDPELLGVLRETAKGPEEAQKLTDAFFEFEARQAEKAQQAFKAARQKQREEIKARPDYAETAPLAIAAIRQFASKEFQDMLGKTGLGDHPLMYDFMVEVGRRLSENRVAVNQNTQASHPPTEESLAKQLYG